MDATYVIEPVGFVVSTRRTLSDDHWDSEHGAVELLAPFDERSLRGLEDFSHVEVIYVLDQATWSEDRVLRHPRGNHSWPAVGIFAQRGKDRPNRIGSSICRILRIDGVRIELEGLDAIEGTPVVDLKPWVAEFGPRGPATQPTWMTELMADYW